MLKSKYTTISVGTIWGLLEDEFHKKGFNDMWAFKSVKQDKNIPSVFYITIKGDWKHHHQHTDELMEGYYGFVKIGEKSIYDSTNDCYKSTHIYAVKNID